MQVPGGSLVRCLDGVGCPKMDGAGQTRIESRPENVIRNVPMQGLKGVDNLAQTG